MWRNSFLASLQPQLFLGIPGYFFSFFFPPKKSVFLGNKYGGTGINMEEQFAQRKKEEQFSQINMEQQFSQVILGEHFPHISMEQDFAQINVEEQFSRFVAATDISIFQAFFFPFFFLPKKSVFLGNKYGGTKINLEEQFSRFAAATALPWYSCQKKFIFSPQEICVPRK